jgi:hypothetical protein
MISELFWGITQRRVVIMYRLFGITYQSHLQGSRTDVSGQPIGPIFKSQEPTFRDNLSVPSSRVKNWSFGTTYQSHLQWSRTDVSGQPIGPIFKGQEPTFRDNLSAPSSRFKNWRFGTTYRSHLLTSWSLKMKHTGCPELSVLDLWRWDR